MKETGPVDKLSPSDVTSWSGDSRSLAVQCPRQQRLVEVDMAEFNPDALLNLEKRTGIKDADIDEFVSKVGRPFQARAPR